MKFSLLALLIYMCFNIAHISNNKIKKSSVKTKESEFYNKSTIDDKKSKRLNEFDNELKFKKENDSLLDSKNGIISNENLTISKRINNKNNNSNIKVLAENDEYVIIKKHKNTINDSNLSTNLNRKISELVKEMNPKKISSKRQKDDDDDDDDKKTVPPTTTIQENKNSTSSVINNITNQPIANEVKNNVEIPKNNTLSSNDVNKSNSNQNNSTSCSTCDAGINVVVFDVELDKPKNIPVVTPKIITSTPTILSKTIVKRSIDLSSPAIVVRKPNVIHSVLPRTTITPLSRDSYGLPVYTTTLGPTVAIVHSR